MLNWSQNSSFITSGLPSVGAYVDTRVMFLNFPRNLNLHSLSLRGSKERKLFLTFEFLINPAQNTGPPFSRTKLFVQLPYSKRKIINPSL